MLAAPGNSNASAAQLSGRWAEYNNAFERLLDVSTALNTGGTKHDQAVSVNSSYRVGRKAYTGNGVINFPDTGDARVSPGLVYGDALTTGTYPGPDDGSGGKNATFATTGLSLHALTIAAGGAQDGAAMTGEGQKWATRDITGAVRDPARVSNGPWEPNRLPD